MPKGRSCRDSQASIHYALRGAKRGYSFRVDLRFKAIRTRYFVGDFQRVAGGCDVLEDI